MSTDPYRVSPSGQAIDQVRAAVRRAEVDGERSLAVRAFRWAMEEMELTPHEFGESRGYLPHAALHRRIAFAGPLVFWFGVHDDTRTVFLVRVRHAKGS